MSLHIKQSFYKDLLLMRYVLHTHLYLYLFIFEVFSFPHVAGLYRLVFC